ncbi:hypothetical protein M2272_000075 [Mycobacterium frederiksbergense]|uniref:Uncharacterized protein n=1 Tax=Mycolicibacterium frederiksbergense TaxID=117567 RepID=A0ABT6KRU4_9MYCO|nr:hypothetical protein [Mycolicibacterium frederiksbergense]MDH6193454.1 hypothetical protein [Mycolicibacterium frederiksbergense]
MSAYHQIFIRTNKSEQDLIRDLGFAASTAINPVHRNEIAYGDRMPNGVIEVELHHDFDDDFGMKFSSYPTVVTVRELNADKTREEQLARTIFEKLRIIGGYELLLAFDLQRLVLQTG